MPRNDRQAHALIVDSAERRITNHARNVAPQRGGLSVTAILYSATIGAAILGAILRIAL